MTAFLNKRMRDLAPALTVICAAVLLIAHSAAVTASLGSAVYRCINVIIPSLFAFMTVTDLLTRSGGYIYLSYILAPLSLLLGLPVSCGAVFAISNVGGYPLGAAMISSMYDRGELDKRSASRLICCCYNGGPAFFSGAVGLAVFGSVRAGMLVYLSIAAANCLFCAVFSRIFPVKLDRSQQGVHFSTGMLSDSVSAAGKSLTLICGMILAFSALTALLEALAGGLMPSGNYGVLADSLLEISNLSELSGRPYRLLPYVAAAGALGGACVLMQVYTLIGGRFPLLPFAAARAVCAVLSWGICSLLAPHFLPAAVSAAAEPEFIVNFNNFTPSLCLIMMIFLTVLQKRLAFSDKV